MLASLEDQLTATSARASLTVGVVVDVRVPDLATQSNEFFVTGFQSQALCCEACGYTAHEDCAREAEASCKQLSVLPLAQPNPEEDHDIYESAPDRQPAPTPRPEALLHHFVQGNHSTVTDLCHVCGLAVGSLFKLSGLHCTWCGIFAHEDCIKQINKSCSLGPYRQLIVPPTAVRAINRVQRNQSILSRMAKAAGRFYTRGRERSGSLMSRDGSSDVSGPPSRAHSPEPREGEEKQPAPRSSTQLWEVENAGLFPDSKPLVIFINRKSGGRMGETLSHEFMEKLNPIQVFDLAQEGGPRRGLELFKDVPNLHVLACGGDGTGAWVLSMIDEMGDQLPYPPTVAILPLGTGNDLARSLGWGGGYSNEE